jgi:hypothetical protein
MAFILTNPDIIFLTLLPVYLNLKEHFVPFQETTQIPFANKVTSAIKPSATSPKCKPFKFSCNRQLFAAGSIIIRQRITSREMRLFDDFRLTISIN